MQGRDNPAEFELCMIRILYRIVSSFFVLCALRCKFLKGIILPRLELPVSWQLLFQRLAAKIILQQ